MTSSEVQIAPAPESTGVERPCWLWYIPELPSSSERPSGPDCRACISGVCMNPVCRVALAATVATMVAMPAVAAPSSAAPSSAAPSSATPSRPRSSRPRRLGRPAAARQPAAPPQEPQDPKYEETVVVSASKTEQKLVDAPATMTVIGAEQDRERDVAELRGAPADRARPEHHPGLGARHQRDEPGAHRHARHRPARGARRAQPVSGLLRVRDVGLPAGESQRDQADRSHPRPGLGRVGRERRVRRRST